MLIQYDQKRQENWTELRTKGINTMAGFAGQRVVPIAFSIKLVEVEDFLRSAADR